MPPTETLTNQTTKPLEVFELPAVPADATLPLDAGLTELPRRHRMKSADIGIPENSYAAIAAAYASGDDTHKKVCDQFLQVFLEMMARTPNPGGVRYICDATGKKMRGPSGGFLAKNCSEFAVDTDDCRAGVTNQKLAPIPEPGHRKTFVEKNWRQIMPRLIFTSEIANPGNAAAGKDYDPKTWEATWAANTADDNAERAALLRWLVPFVKTGARCTWDGRK